MRCTRTLLIVSGGTEAVAGIARAREMGLHVVVSDGDPNAPGFELAHDRIVASTYDVDATVRGALDYTRDVRPIDGVLSIASDVPITVAAVAEALALPGISPATAALSADKLAMKRRFARDAVAIPWFHPVDDVRQLGELVEAEGRPLILKPVDSRGARGVLQLLPDVDLDWAYDFARSQSPSGRVMLERFLAGPQISTESLMIGGVAHTPGFADRNYELLASHAPFVIENGGSLPSHLGPELRAEVCDLVERAGRSLGVVDGVVKGDIVVSDGRPYVIEIATRLSGGYLCTHEIPLSTGVDFVACAIRQALGEKVDAASLIPRYETGVAQRWLFAEPGCVVDVPDVESVRKRSDVAFVELRVEAGCRVEPVISHATRPGVVIATGPTRLAAERAALAAVASLKIETIPAA